MYQEIIQQIEAEADPVIKFGKIKKLVKELETEVEFLKPVVTPIIQEMKEGNDDPDAPVAVPDLGQFNTYVKATYEYSAEIQEKEKELKKLKANEVREGVATVTEEKVILVFK